MTVRVMRSSLVKSLLPSRSSTIMVKPLALPMPWIGGGISTKPVASVISSMSGLQMRDR